MGIFKYLCKVFRNKDNVYEREKRTLKEAGSFMLTFIVCIGLLAFPLLRKFLKWLAYFSVGSFAIFMFCGFVGSLFEIIKAFRYAKKLEKIGTSVEEEEMARRALCEIEGDDGLPSKEN